MKPASRPAISVIVPCYNHGAFLAEALDSVLAQTFSNWDCVIVDDGSSDNSCEVARQYVSRDGRITLLELPHCGVSAARNLGIEKSKGRYILPLDADDKIGPGYLDACVSHLDTDRDIGIVYCKAELFGEESGPWNLPDYSLERMLIGNVIFCTAAYRRSDFDRTKGYRQVMDRGLEDWDFWLSLMKFRPKVRCLPETHFYYRKKPSSRSKSYDSAVELDLKHRIILEHRELYEDCFGTADPMKAFSELHRLQYLHRSPWRVIASGLKRLLLPSAPKPDKASSR